MQLAVAQTRLGATEVHEITIAPHGQHHAYHQRPSRYGELGATA